MDCGAEGLSIDPNSPLVRFTVNGEQVLDITPIEVPIGWNPPETIEMTIARLVRNEVSRAAEAAGYDTLDEAYDFDTPEGDEYEEHLTPHELHAMMHSPEMKEERPLDKAEKENANGKSVRVRVDSRSSEDSGAADSVGDGGKGFRGSGKAKASKHRENVGGEGEAVEVRGGDHGSGDRGNGERGYRSGGYGGGDPEA